MRTFQTGTRRQFSLIARPHAHHTLLAASLNLVTLIFGASLACLGQHPHRPEEFLRSQMHLSTSQIADIHKGKAVAKILRSSNPSYIFVFGAVYIYAKPVEYLQLMRDSERSNKLNGYLGAGEFSSTPAIHDMDRLSLDNDDIKDLKNCRPDSCELQLPEGSMESTRNTIDWDSPNVAQQVNELAKHGICGATVAEPQVKSATSGRWLDARIAFRLLRRLSRFSFSDG